MGLGSTQTIIAENIGGWVDNKFATAAALSQQLTTDSAQFEADMAAAQDKKAAATKNVTENLDGNYGTDALKAQGLSAINSNKELTPTTQNTGEMSTLFKIQALVGQGASGTSLAVQIIDTKTKAEQESARKS
jgi:hypothetical protein